MTYAKVDVPIHNIVKRRFAGMLPAGRLFEVRAAEAEGYTAITVYIANLTDDARLATRAKRLAREVADDLLTQGYPTAIYVKTYDPRTRRV